MAEFIEWECPRCGNWVISKAEVWCNGSKDDHHPPVGMKRWEGDTFDKSSNQN